MRIGVPSDEFCPLRAIRANAVPERLRINFPKLLTGLFGTSINQHHKASGVPKHTATC